MNLAQALRLTRNTAAAFVGAGGKTTAIFQLARQLESPVIVAATTHLGAWQLPLADQHFVIQTQEAAVSFNKALPGGVTLFTGPLEGDRTRGLTPEASSWIREIARTNHAPLLIEADGSQGRPIKAPAAHEPAIPDFVDTVIVVAGLSALGKPLTDKWVHRPEIFQQLNDVTKSTTVRSRWLAQVLLHPEGGLKNIPDGARRIALLNQADTPDLQAKAKRLAQGLLSAYHEVVICALEGAAASTPGPISAVYEPVAGIILAAGQASRFGQAKQLLRWRDKPLIRTVAQTALTAGLAPVIVVTGANAEAVEAAVSDLRVTIVRNDLWKEGQSTSIRAGLDAINKYVGAALFLLADQPQVTPALIRALLERRSQDLPLILAPMVEDRRANPVVFDRETFSDLAELTGDVGGRAIFSQYRVEYLPWLDSDLLLDVDTPEDYEQLLNRE